MGWWGGRSFFYRNLSACCCKGCTGGFGFFRAFSVYRSLLLYGSSVLGANIAEEVISCWSLCNSKCVVFSSNPPEFYPAAPFPVEGNWVEALGGRSFGVVSYCFLVRYSIVRDRSPLYPSIYVSFRGSLVLAPRLVHTVGSPNRPLSTGPGRPW